MGLYGACSFNTIKVSEFSCGASSTKSKILDAFRPDTKECVRNRMWGDLISFQMAETRGGFYGRHFPISVMFLFLQ